MFYLFMDVIDHVSILGHDTAYLKKHMCDKLIDHKKNTIRPCRLGYAGNT